MPRISEFFGVVVSVYYNEHGPPHVHVLHGGQGAVLSPAGGVVSGGLSLRALRLVREWAALHRRELRRNWLLARKGHVLERIAPLE